MHRSGALPRAEVSDRTPLLKSTPNSIETAHVGRAALYYPPTTQLGSTLVPGRVSQLLGGVGRGRCFRSVPDQPSGQRADVGRANRRVSQEPSTEGTTFVSVPLVNRWRGVSVMNGPVCEESSETYVLPAAPGIFSVLSKSTASYFLGVDPALLCEKNSLSPPSWRCFASR